VPAPQTTIGIGEAVNCSIDPNTWQDTDYLVTESGNDPVPDSMGTITWTVSGSGTIYPTTGDSTTLTADLADADNTITIQASIPDSGTEGIDPVIVKAVAFAVKVPNGANATKKQDVARRSPWHPRPSQQPYRGTDGFQRASLAEQRQLQCGQLPREYTGE
jgi:hypothetical protein